MVDRFATEVLVGNHEVGVMLDFMIYPRTPESFACRQLLFDRVLGEDPESAWKAATCVDGVLVTHAGVSSEYERVFREHCQGDASLLAAHLNTSFLEAVRRELETGEWEVDGILGEGGPTWFRPRPYSAFLPMSGLRQVVGHTPPVPELEQVGFHMVDPCASMGMDDLGRFRYAVIEGGQVRVEEGTLTRFCVDAQACELAESLCR